MKTGGNNGKELDEDELQSVVRYYKDRIIECMGLETKGVQNNEHQPSNSDGTADG